MSATLYLAPTTESVLAHIVDSTRGFRRERPLAPLTFLLPSGDAIRQLRRSLGDVDRGAVPAVLLVERGDLSEAGSSTHEMSDLADTAARARACWPG